ncbi:MAG: hypothetical protein ABI851_15325 [Saprospiraceae bacterium]
MKLEKFKEESYEFSKLTSDLVRQFTFAGIAIVWIFKFEKPQDHLIPTELIFPLLCFVLTLACDLLQYLFPTIIWTIFFRHYENKFKGNTEKEIKANPILTLPGWIFFIAKIIFLAIGFICVIKFLIIKI